MSVRNCTSVNTTLCGICMFMCLYAHGKSDVTHTVALAVTGRLGLARHNVGTSAREQGCAAAVADVRVAADCYDYAAFAAMRLHCRAEQFGDVWCSNLWLMVMLR